MGLNDGPLKLVDMISKHFLAVNELDMATAQNGESPKRTHTTHQTPAFLSVILCLLDAAS